MSAGDCAVPYRIPSLSMLAHLQGQFMDSVQAGE